VERRVKQIGAPTEDYQQLERKTHFKSRNQGQCIWCIIW